eukprot:jgi/Chlat1/3460/Chrsp23S08828
MATAVASSSLAWSSSTSVAEPFIERVLPSSSSTQDRNPRRSKRTSQSVALPTSHKHENYRLKGTRRTPQEVKATTATPSEEAAFDYATPLLNVRVPTTCAALGAFQSATIEKTGLDLSTPEFESEAHVVLPELFDRTTINCILEEWYKTIASLPAGIRQAVEMGLVSSAQLARFLSFDCRPTIVRNLSRLPIPELQRAAVGRMMGDPGFVYKFAVEQAFTIATAVAWEAKSRGKRLAKEWDQALVNVLTMAVANGTVVWMLAPSRSFGVTHRFGWQNALQQLPNNVFDKSGPLRNYTTARRAQAFVAKAAELSAAGMAIGAVGGALSNGLAALHSRSGKNESSAHVPGVGTSALGYGAFVGLAGNLRYQLLAGLDRVMSTQFNHMGLIVFANLAARYLNIRLGESARLQWLGYQTDGGDLADLSKAASSIAEKTRSMVQNHPPPAGEDVLLRLVARGLT